VAAGDVAGSGSIVLARLKKMGCMSAVTANDRAEIVPDQRNEVSCEFGGMSHSEQVGLALKVLGLCTVTTAGRPAVT
jgi:hypothetical protein